MSLAVHFSSKSNEWETPQDFFDELDKEFHFTLDHVRHTKTRNVISITPKKKMD